MENADRAARIIRTILGELQPGFAVRLWNGERIGPPNGSATGLTLVINDSVIVGRVMRRPTIEAWAPYRDRQTPSPIRTTVGAPGRSSSGRTSRPSSGATPKARKPDADSDVTSTRSGGTSSSTSVIGAVA